MTPRDTLRAAALALDGTLAGVSLSLLGGRARVTLHRAVGGERRQDTLDPARLQACLDAVQPFMAAEDTCYLALSPGLPTGTHALHAVSALARQLAQRHPEWTLLEIRDGVRARLTPDVTGVMNAHRIDTTVRLMVEHVRNHASAVPTPP